MIDIEQAYETLFASIKPGPTTVCSLGDALYRTLASPVVCDVDCPPFDRAVMDGYAVRVVDVRDVPARLRIVGRLAAGANLDKVLGSREAIQINTGAPIPHGADAVVPVEDTESGSTSDTVIIGASAPAGQYITRRGTFAVAGETVLETGTPLTPREIGTAATVGASELTVYRRPTVAILPTGDELVDVHEKPSGSQIRNSNQYLLQALVHAAHAEPVTLGVVRDDPELLYDAIVRGLESDILCISGGVSVGPLDYVPEVLQRCDATFHIRKLSIKPGRPLVFATMPNGTLVFGLPGNPGSAFVCFELMVKPALAALQGRPGSLPPLVKGVLIGSIKVTGDRQTYLPARAHLNADGVWEVSPVSWRGSGNSIGLAYANALVVRCAEAAGASAGDQVMFIPLEGF